MPKFTVENFVKFRDLIYNRVGIKFEEKKIYFVKRRVFKRMQELNIDSVKEYYHYLKFYDKYGVEFQKLINELTTNETYFFREYPQLEVFANVILAEFEEHNKFSDRRLRIWSAGCSSGEEPYTLAIITMEILDNYKKWDIEIIASDIDEKVLEKARQGVYQWRSVKKVPPEYLAKYFSKQGDDYVISDEVKRMVHFEKLNLVDNDAMRKKRNIDFLFCRNVLIYFDMNSRRSVIEHFYRALKPGGYIFLGHSESIGRITTAFSIRKVNNFILYRKPFE